MGLHYQEMLAKQHQCATVKLGASNNEKLKETRKSEKKGNNKL